MTAKTLSPAELLNAPDQRPDDRFVPLRAEALAARLADDGQRFGADAEQIPRVFDALRDVVEQETQACRRWVLTAYDPLNPDRDTHPSNARQAGPDADAVQWFEQAAAYLLDKANFDRLSEVELERVAQQANSLGLRVRLDPERIESLSVWVRGPTTVQRCVRTWRHPRRGELRDIELYRRLAVVAKLCDEPHMRLKLFKDIPATDVEALLPHADVSMSLLDRLKLTFGSLGALGSAGTKVFQAITGGVIVIGVLLWPLLVATAMLAFKAFTGYRRSRSQRDAQRTRHLYFQNLSNNAGVIHSLLAMISEEEVKEALLAYAFCNTDDGKLPDLDALDRRIEAYLAEQLGCDVNFDATDALETLTRLGLRDARAPLGVWRPADAIARLREHWRDRRSWDYHRHRVGGAAE